LGVNIEKLSDGIKMIQPYLMDHRVKGLGINDRTKAKSRTAVVPNYNQMYLWSPLTVEHGKYFKTS